MHALIECPILKAASDYKYILYIPIIAGVGCDVATALFLENGWVIP